MAFDFPVPTVIGEEFVSPPPGPTYQWDGVAWQLKPDIVAGVIISDTPPPTPVHGDQWWESDTGKLYVYYIDIDGGQWVQTNIDSGIVGISDAPADNIQYMRQDALWVPPVATVPGWELIESAWYTNITHWQRTDLDAYRTLRLTCQTLNNLNGVTTYLRTSDDNGATWSAGASDYYLGMRAALNNVDVASGTWMVPAIQANSGTYIAYGATGGGSFDYIFEDFNQPSAMHYVGESEWQDYATGVLANSCIVCGYRNAMLPCNGIRVFGHAGGWARISVQLYGIRG